MQSTHPRTRIIRRALTCLALGAVLNTLIAWWFALAPNVAWLPDPHWLWGRSSEYSAASASAAAFPSAAFMRWTNLNVTHQEFTARKWYAEEDTVAFFGSIDRTRPGRRGWRATRIPEPDDSIRYAWLGPRAWKSEPGRIPRSLRRHLSVPGHTSHDDRSENALTVFVLESGWPFGSFSQGMIFRYRKPVSERHAWAPAPVLKTLAARGSIPLRPIPLGFTLNTIFYAALLFLPCHALGVATRARRRARGLCANCRYPVAEPPGSTANCPECGATLQNRRIARTAAR